MTTTIAPDHEKSRVSQNWATAAHLSAFVAFLGVPSPIGPLAVWLLHKDDASVEEHAKEALNFNISFLIYGVVAAISIVLLVGIVALPVVLITWFALVIAASLSASRGERYRYPFTMRLIT